MTTNELLIKTKKASRILSSLSESEKNKILFSIADALENYSDDILLANAEDVKNAKGKLTESMIDRLTLTKARIKAMADGIREVADLADPCSGIISRYERADGLIIEKKAVPFGVIAIIYESRPNVTSDAAALCIKSGNACVLRSGRDAYLSSKSITEVMKKGIEAAGYPADIIGIVDDPSRKSAEELMCAKGLVDLLIPRGGKGLIKSVVENATVPCIETGTGICHVYLDDTADSDKALDIIENAKTQRPSVCNAMEVLIIHSSRLEDFLPRLYERLVTKREKLSLKPVKLIADKRASLYINAEEADEESFDTEFLDYTLAIKTVDTLSEAIEHIDIHSTHHSDCIITENNENARIFTESVDSAAVYVNVSTRFTDGGEFGFGCEMGISTQKLHARGPMGLPELCTYKYIVKGNGHTR